MRTLLVKVYHGDACPAKLYVLVAIGTDIGDGMQVLANQLAQDAAARAVEDAHTRHAHENGIVDEVGDGIDSLIAAHAAHVQILAEIQLARVYRLARLVR